MLSNVARFMVRKADELVASRIGTSSQFGVYNVGADLGLLPTGEVGPAILKAFFPVLSSIQHDNARVKSGVLKVLAIVNSVTLPAGLGLCAIAGPATLLMLGPNWSGAIPYVKIFGIIGAVQVAANPLSTLLVMRGFTKIQTRIVWLEFAVFAIASALFVPLFHLSGLALGRLCGALASLVLVSYECHSKCDFPIKPIASTLWRPLTSSIAMYFIASNVLALFANPIVGMAAAIFAGVVTYVVLMLGSWKIVGKPPGLENEVVGFIKTRLSKR